MTKQEKIQEAYGDKNFNEFNEFIDSDGWALYPNFQKHELIEEIKELEFNKINFRPKSLQGIENNNGWIKIESEADLPKQTDIYYVIIFEDILDTANFDLEVERWYSNNESIRRFPTHYQPIEKPLKPIY